MDYTFSVLLSVYQKEKAEYLKEAIESVYFNQILKPNEIILVEDGPLTEKLYSTIAELKLKIGKNILKTIKLEKNMGLGNALRIGIEKCSNELVARMDTDDIAYPNRFEEQINYFKNYPETDVLGSFMSEFVDNIENIICIKDAPNNSIDMKKYMKLRDPVNHPSVMFKKSKVLEAGNYKEIFLNEDSYLWGRMLNKGCTFRNIQESLVYFRITDDTYKRRGGWKYIKAEYGLQKEFLKLGIINKIEFIRNITLKNIIRLMPNSLRKIIYLQILRKGR
jgi:glycosyltransferase involved in cell wall biosynthesis